MRTPSPKTSTLRPAPVPTGSNLVAVDKDELRDIVETVLTSALSEERRADRSGAAALVAAAEVERDQADSKLKRVKLWAGCAVSVVVIGSALFTWIYGRGQDAQAQTQHEAAQDAGIAGASVRIESLEKTTTKASADQSEKIRNLGALQIEQGNDQRHILLKSAPKSVREELEKKPDELIEAEGRVLRD